MLYLSVKNKGNNALTWMKKEFIFGFLTSGLEFPLSVSSITCSGWDVSQCE